jgi:hypothetical protein
MIDLGIAVCPRAPGAQAMPQCSEEAQAAL